jgi:hypothetical protein
MIIHTFHPRSSLHCTSHYFILNQVVGPFGSEVINGNGDKLIDVCEQNSLKILNGYFKHKKLHQHTWHQDTVELKSIMDYIISRKNSDLNYQNVRVFIGMTLGRDHYLVNAEIRNRLTTQLQLNKYYYKNNANESRETTTDCTSESVQLPLYNIDSLRDESTSFFYVRRDLMRNLE